MASWKSSLLHVWNALVARFRKTESQPPITHNPSLPMFNYGVGGQERKGPAAIEAIADIPQNRTLLVEKLTSTPPVRSEVVHGLKNVDDVFEKFKPSLKVDFQTEEGSRVTETLNFRGLGDFGRKGITNQSPYLQKLAGQQEDYLKFTKELKSNKLLQSALQNKDTKEAYLKALQAMIRELESPA